MLQQLLLEVLPKQPLAGQHGLLLHVLSSSRPGPRRDAAKQQLLTLEARMLQPCSTIASHCWVQLVPNPPGAYHPHLWRIMLV